MATVDTFNNPMQDPDGFERYWKEVGTKICIQCASWFLPIQDVGAVESQVYLQLEKYPGEVSPPVIRRTTRWKCLDFLRKQKRQAGASLDTVVQQAAPDNGPAVRYATQETYRKIQELLHTSKLPSWKIMAFQLYTKEEKTNGEIAAELQKSKSSVSTAIKEVRQELEWRNCRDSETPLYSMWEIESNEVKARSGLIKRVTDQIQERADSPDRATAQANVPEIVRQVSKTICDGQQAEEYLQTPASHSGMIADVLNKMGRRLSGSGRWEWNLSQDPMFDLTRLQEFQRTLEADENIKKLFTPVPGQSEEHSQYRQTIFDLLCMAESIRNRQSASDDPVQTSVKPIVDDLKKLNALFQPTLPEHGVDKASYDALVLAVHQAKILAYQQACAVIIAVLDRTPGCEKRPSTP